MVWLAIHMWMLLLGAFAIGLAAGLSIGAVRRRSQHDEEADTPLGTLYDDAPRAPDQTP